MATETQINLAGHPARTTIAGLCGSRVYWENLGARVCLVGEAPGPTSDPSAPLFYVPSGSTGARLVDLMGVGHAEYSRLFGHVNLLVDHPGDRWPRGLAQTRAAQIQDAVLAAQRPIRRDVCFVLLGRRVVDAFFDPMGHGIFKTEAPMAGESKTLGGIAFGDMDVPPSHHYFHIPHPSGANRWYRDPANRERAECALARVVEFARGVPNA